METGITIEELKNRLEYAKELMIYLYGVIIENEIEIDEELPEWVEE